MVVRLIEGCIVEMGLFVLLVIHVVEIIRNYRKSRGAQNTLGDCEISQHNKMFTFRQNSFVLYS